MARYKILEGQIIPTEVSVMKDFHPPNTSVPPTPKKGVAVLTKSLTTAKKLDRYSVMEERVFVKHKKF